MRYSKSRNAGTGRLTLTLGTRNVIWIFLFHFSFVSSASWLILEGVMSTTHQAVITLSRIVFLCDGWLRHAIPISRIRIIHLREFFFISWAGSRMRDDCYVGRTHRSLQDKLELIVCSMFTVPNVFGAWQRPEVQCLEKACLAGWRGGCIVVPGIISFFPWYVQDWWLTGSYSYLYICSLTNPLLVFLPSSGDTSQMCLHLSRCTTDQMTMQCCTDLIWSSMEGVFIFSLY